MLPFVQTGQCPMSTFATAETLNLLKVRHAPKDRRGDLVQVKALPSVALSHLKMLLDITDAQLAELIGVPPRSYHRHKGSGEALKPAQADSALRIARVVREAIRVFDDTGKALRWIKAPNPILGAAPLELIGSDAGSQAVQDELMRIHWGDLA